MLLKGHDVYRLQVYVFRPQGELILDFETGGNSAVTALTSYSVRRNESMIVAGHHDGSVTVHKVRIIRLPSSSRPSLCAL
jgi:hypothetical protein